MREFQSLKFIALFKGLFKKFGVDYEIMMLILRIKLTMDERRVPTVFNEMGKKKEGNQFLKSLWIYGLYSLLLLPFLFLGDNYIFGMSVQFGIILFILMTSMISDFSSVLLDVRDKNVLQTKPVDKKTITAAKTIHILIYMSFIAGAFVALPFIVGIFRHGIVFSLIFLVEIVLTMLLVVVFTSLLYLFVLRYFDGERLKDIINYVQIVLSLGLVIGYQVLIQAFDIANFNIEYVFSPWHFLIPPIWYGAPFEMILNGNTAWYMIAFTGLAVLMPILAILIYSRLMPSFERNLEKLLSDTKARKPSRSLLDGLWAKLLCRTKEERVFFRFSALMLKKEREFKLKVFPNVGLALVFPILFIFNELRIRSLADISEGNMYLFIYFCNILIPGTIFMLQFAGSYKGGWIFKAAPIARETAAYSAALKVFLSKLYLPIFLVLSIVYVGIFSARILPDLAAVLAGAILQSLITYRVMKDVEFPFTRSFEFSQDQGTARNLSLTLIIGAFVLVHFLARSFDYGIYVYLVLLVVAIFVVWRKTFPENAEVEDGKPASKTEAGM
ncbi:hypothetical protein [Planococcus sp. CAU13]|uniref:hypothetical protein n=1 Tax=Planococcus sp. CAU13 TaxID=1541197 RepID=UPI00052FF117|nr:hypothetical protein [Planococcus sp. CAU13]